MDMGCDRKQITTADSLSFPDADVRDVPDPIDRAPVLREERLSQEKTAKLRKGSLTTEAALAVPFFFLCAVALICVLDLYSTLAKETAVLQVRAEKLAEARSAAGEGSGLPAVIDLPEVKKVTPFGLPFSVSPVRIYCRARVRAWVGYDPEEDHGDTEGDEGKMVYVTDYESVYHTHSDCTHLDLTVECISLGAARRRRNLYGSRYHTCEKCIGSGAANHAVFLSPHGDAYHNSSSCSGLTRHVRLESMDDVGGLSLCSRCAAR